MAIIEFELVPHRGFGVIALGMDRRDVQAAMKELNLKLENNRNNMDYYCEASVQVEYVEETVSFVGISHHDSIHCTFKGNDVFATKSIQLFSLFASGENELCEYDDYEFVFPDQIITVWNADSQYDRKGGEVEAMYAQIGLGDDRYFQAIQRIHHRNDA